MGRVALVEAYPYEAVWGGDAVYLDRIRAFLTERGHSVDSYITDMSRGRSNPTMRLQTRAGGRHRWIVRNAVPLGEGRFCSLDPKFIGKSVARLPGQRASPDHGTPHAEADWLRKRLTNDPPDLVILTFGACAFTDRLLDVGAPLLALKGFFSDRRIRLGEAMPAPSVDRALLESLGRADRVGFNNRHDLDFYRQRSLRDNGMLVGMGFPARPQPAPGGAPTLLFVGAQTRPNIASLRWFLDHIWPRVFGQVPAASLRVAGAVGGAFDSGVPTGVSMLGFTDDLEGEYRRAWAVIAPLVSGSSGIKTKIAEALSFARPIVTTSLGVDQACPSQYGAAVDVADEPSAFAAALVRLLAHREQLDERIRLAAECFAANFSEQAAYWEIADLIERPAIDRRAAVP